MKKCTVIFSIMIAQLLTVTTVSAQSADPSTQKSDIRFSADVYASHAHLMQYQGLQTDLVATMYLQYQEWVVKPFLRASYSNYEFGSRVKLKSYSRTAGGIGADINVGKYLRVRLQSEMIHSTETNNSYPQDSYGLIYNQYINLGWFELNNYAESFYIPRASTSQMDTYARVQILKTFYLISEANNSHALFPFVEYRGRFNDEINFGISGHVTSGGAGYKYYRHTADGHSAAVLLEAHSVINQSQDFNGDWWQALVALQYQYQ